MAAATGIWNHAMAGHALPSVTAMPQDTSGDSGSGSSDDSATISANDFLTLLVTEMQNQDPTADTDPNEYINQLINVNSLEQLISMNQTLTGAFGSTSSAGTPSGDSQNGTTASPVEAPLATVAAGAHAHAPAHSSSSSAASGNLSIPEMNAAAQRVAQSLSGQSF